MTAACQTARQDYVADEANYLLLLPNLPNNPTITTIKTLKLNPST